MNGDEKKRKKDELDSFWEIDALIPPRRAPHYPHDTEAVEIESASPNSKASEETSRSSAATIPPRGDAPKLHFIPPHTPEEEASRPKPILEYAPENALVRRVRIYPHKSNFRYYEGFVRDAERLYRVGGVECPRVPFFSYVPQYSQMNRAQLEWYLWWRENARRGEYLDTDYSYVLLYLYEILNLSGLMDAAKSQRELCALWLRYRAIFRQMDGYLPDWICDYSLVHRLPPPNAESGVTMSTVMTHCTLKEFYVPCGGNDGYLLALLAFCSNYDYKKSKFYTEANRDLFDRVVTGALKLVTEHLSGDGKLFSNANMDDSRMIRDAYTGALCAHRTKCRIEVEYCSFSRSHELRFFITDVVKYTENQLRSVLGVRSRLSVYALPTSVRELLDAYLRETLPKRSAAKARPEVQEEYEKLYDLPKTELSLSHAASIERLSWETTERLVEAFEEADEPAQSVGEFTAPITEPAAECLEEADGAARDSWANYRDYLHAIYHSDTARQKAAARERGLPEEVLVDEINTLAADLLDDILLEETDCGFSVIEDYRELLHEILSSL